MKLVSRSLLSLLAVLFLASMTNAQYVGSAKSDKYHSKTCQHAKRIKAENLVEFDTVQAATDAGYVPCKVCKPGGAARSATKTETGTVETKDLAPSTEQDVSSGRCQATTKKGTQCKRSASAGSDYCWQHGG